MTTSETKYGYIAPVIQPEDYLLGSLVGPILQPDGDWSSFLPEPELQNRGFETYACTLAGLTNAIEILERHEYGVTSNWSERWLAQKTGTKEKKGNDPGMTAQYLYDHGVPPEREWPFDAKNYDDFYKEPPMELDISAAVFKAKYAFGHEWLVNPTPENIVYALDYSPVGVAVHAWTADEEGLYYRPSGAPDTHWTIIYGYKKGEYFKVFDTYNNTLKHLRWDFGFNIAKKYTLHKQLSTTKKARKAWLRFRKLINKILGR